MLKDKSQNINIYDTTLRDGSQAESISFSCQDKIAIAVKLDDLGINYIEGGYPLSNPKDQEFFHSIKKLDLKNSKIAAFGSTRKSNIIVENDPGINALLFADTPVVTIVGKSWDFHVKEVLHTTLEENLKMVEDSINYLKSKNREVIFDAEHFFDGYKNNPEYAFKVIDVAQNSGADTIVLCDTNGGCLPLEIGEIVKSVKKDIKTALGIHTHNDSDAAVANSLIAVHYGASHIQGTINGIGERCGNADLCSIIPNLTLKTNYKCIEDSGIKKITEVSRFVYETANLVPRQNQPFVGKSAFTHKGGLHAHAILKNKDTYEHIDPEIVGNERRILVSELSGGASILAKIEKYSMSNDKNLMQNILKQVQDLENEGYQFESADGSFDLLVKKTIGRHKSFFDLEEFRVIVEKNKTGLPISEAIVKLKIDNNIEFTVGEGDGPVHALDSALRKALGSYFPTLTDMHLVDYKVRVINPISGTAAKVRVIIESRDANTTWGTVGVSENLIDASWHALVDSIEYKLLKDLEKSPDDRFKVQITVKNWQNRFLPENQRGKDVKVDATVDTEIAELALPSEIIKCLRLEKVGNVNVYTANKGVHEYNVMGMTDLYVHGRNCQVRVIELPKGSEPLLGTIPIKEMELQILQSEKKLVPKPRINKTS